MKQKLAMLLCAVLVLSLLPVQAMAVEDAAVEASAETVAETTVVETTAETVVEATEETVAVETVAETISETVEETVAQETVEVEDVIAEEAADAAVRSESWIQEQINKGKTEIVLDADVVLNNDFILPNGLFVSFNGHTITVPAGKTLDVRGQLGFWFEKGGIIVEAGGALVNNCYIGTSGILDVRGSFTDNGWVHTASGFGETVINGIPDSAIWMHYVVDKGNYQEDHKDLFLEYLNRMNSTNYGWYSFQLHGNLTLPCDLVIPRNCSFILESAPFTLTIPSGRKIVNNGEFIGYADQTVVNNGTVENAGYMEVYSTWIGNEPVQVESSLPKLGTPVDLKWSNGYMNWTMTEPHHFNAETKLYKVGQQEPLAVFGHGWSGKNNHSFNALHTIDPENGASYYFTVQARPNNNEYQNSDIATSPIWTFVKPAESMGACSNVSFDGEKLTWTAPADADGNTTYVYRFLFAADKNLENTNVEHLNFMWGRFNGSVNVKEQNDWAYRNMRIGYYFVDVRAESNDISVKYHGPWSTSNMVYFNGSSFEPVHTHTYTDVVTKPTCGEKGYTTHTCSGCGDSYVDTEVAATGKHTYQNDRDESCDVCGALRPVAPAVPGDTVPMYRLYNPNSGEHFYTQNIAECEMLMSLGWNYEGVAWNAPVNAGAPVYRLYNPNAGEHHYTTSAAERDMLVSYGWNDEGIGWRTAGNDQEPVYRVYNPNEFANNHHYTRDANERDWLVGLGWVDEGIGWYGVRK